jgi:hypothetical protein
MQNLTRLLNLCVQLELEGTTGVEEGRNGISKKVEKCREKEYIRHAN